MRAGEVRRGLPVARALCCSVPVLALALAVLTGATCSAEDGAREHARAALANAGDRSAAPPARILLISDLEGVLEPCGCGGRRLGGLDRLAAAVDRARRERPALVIAAGDVFSDGSTAAPRAQDALEASAIGAVLERMQLAAIVPSPSDARLAAAQLQGLARERVTLIAPKSPFLEDVERRASALLALGDRRIGLVRGDALESARHIAELRAQGATAVVRFEHGPERAPSPSESDADVVIRTGGTGEHARHEGETLHLAPSARGEALWVIEVPDGARGERRARAERIALDPGAPADASVRALLDQTFARIHTLNEAHTADAAELAAEERRARGAPFVGSRTCAACHTRAYLWWQRSAHGRAYATLVGRRRELDLDCIGCHVTGFGEPHGARLGRLSELKDVGCESCHGAGGAHVEDPRSTMRRAVAEDVCARCHDAAHSPQFDYARWHARLLTAEHGGRLKRRD